MDLDHVQEEDDGAVEGGGEVGSELEVAEASVVKARARVHIRALLLERAALLNMANGRPGRSSGVGVFSKTRRLFKFVS